MAEQQTVKTVVDVLALRARTEPERTAIVVDTDLSLTFGEWERRSNQIGHALVAAGVRKGDRIALKFRKEDWIPYAIAYLGALKAGAAGVHLSELLPAQEVERRLEQCQVSRVIHSAGVSVPAGRLGIPFSDLHSENQGPVGVALEGNDIAGITYTSGTTSAQPRALLLPHRDHVQSFDPERPRDYEKSKFFTGPFPIGTPSSQNIVISAVTGVPTVVFLTSVDPEFVCRVIAARGIDNIMLTPTMAADIVNSGAAERHDTSSVREISTGAAPITTTMLERVARSFPNAKITQFYVSSETVPGLTMMVFDPSRPGAVGKPMGETQIAIRDASGADLPAGELGQICLNHPRKSRRHLIPSSNDNDGWISTGDLGHVDQDGYLHFFDRVADAVHCGTKLISTLHVENVLQQHPDVLDACVVGVPHPETGQAVAAAVVLKAEGSANEVLRFARERLEPQAVPCKVLVEQYLPRGIIGKPLKREVRAWFDPSSGQAALASHRKRDRCYW